MEKISNIIVLSGLACSGKTTIGKALARRLGYAFFSAGSYLRKHVDENLGIDINAYQTYCDAYPEADIDFDRYFKDVVARASEAGGVVVDYRLGAHFFPSAISIFLKVSPGEAARRVQSRQNEDLATIRIRDASSRRRLISIYGFDYTDESKYQIIRLNEGAGVEDIVDGLVTTLESGRSL